ncbi:MAG: hypothetical protein NPIRA04_02000 [Nitrospirales bacterium]|nr:MAG: hypothetical protein NPIRA04_02000 [Nitrospirales bacterium]
MLKDQQSVIAAKTGIQVFIRAYMTALHLMWLPLDQPFSLQPGGQSAHTVPFSGLL